MEDIIKRIYDYSLEEIMGERFGKYSKYIIQDRAIPDVRDGLKPVQRRILFSMYKEKNTYDKPYKKSARAVGDVMGKYHPHGDSSIYDAIVRMSQSWKMREPFVDMQGNNGSIDGDSAAASRYTETRLSKIAGAMLKDIDKDTVVMAPNYDDTLLEPTVLPAKFPNLLVNGTTGISAGYATNIPPHNLGEVIDATIYRIEHPDCELDKIMKYIKGPDFPTGAIIEGIDGIKSAYKTGRGKIIIKSRATIEKNKIIISEIPYEVNKAQLVKKIDEIRIDKKIDGISEVRDESDKTGLQIAIDLKKDADATNILNYLYKNTELQISYNFNMISIVNRRPMLLGVIGILDAYIAHQREVVLKRTNFDLEHAKARYHIVEGLIKAISVLDEVIKIIRASKDRQDSINNLISRFEFTEAQATAIVEEVVINAMPVYNFDDDIYVTSFTKNGMIKRTWLKEFKVQRYSKAINMMKLKPGDKVVDVSYSKEKNILIATTKGYGLWYDVEEVSPVGIKAAGVKSINLKDDTVVSGILFNASTEYLSIIMDKGTAKRLKLSEIDKSSRANRGLLLMKEIKSNPSKIIKVYALPTKNEIVVTTKNYEKELKLSEIPIMDRYSNGSYIVKDKIIDTHELTKLTSKEDLEKEVEVEPVVEKHQESLKEIDDRMMTIDDLLKNMEK